MADVCHAEREYPLDGGHGKKANTLCNMQTQYFQALTSMPI